MQASESPTAVLCVYPPTERCGAHHHRPFFLLFANEVLQLWAIKAKLPGAPSHLEPLQAKVFSAPPISIPTEHPILRLLQVYLTLAKLIPGLCSPPRWRACSCLKKLLSLPSLTGKPAYGLVSSTPCPQRQSLSWAPQCLHLPTAPCGGHLSTWNGDVPMKLSPAPSLCLAGLMESPTSCCP